MFLRSVSPIIVQYLRFVHVFKVLHILLAAPVEIADRETEQLHVPSHQSLHGRGEGREQVQGVHVSAAGRPLLQAHLHPAQLQLPQHVQDHADHWEISGCLC